MTLSELGIAAVAGSYGEPWAWLRTLTAPIDTRVQAAWYQAACNAVSDEQIGGGVYWYEGNLRANPPPPRPLQAHPPTVPGPPAPHVHPNCLPQPSATPPYRTHSN